MPPWLRTRPRNPDLHGLLPRTDRQCRVTWGSPRARRLSRSLSPPPPILEMKTSDFCTGYASASSLTCQRPPWSPSPFSAWPACPWLSGPWWPLSGGRGRCLHGGGGHRGACPSTCPRPPHAPLGSALLLSPSFAHHLQRSWWKCHRRAQAPSPWVAGGCEANSIPWGGSGDLQSPVGCVELLWEPPGARDQLPEGRVAPALLPPKPRRCVQLPPRSPS